MQGGTKIDHAFQADLLHHVGEQVERRGTRQVRRHVGRDRILRHDGTRRRLSGSVRFAVKAIDGELDAARWTRLS
jgi:hypothetical protein